MRKIIVAALLLCACGDSNSDNDVPASEQPAAADTQAALPPNRDVQLVAATDAIIAFLRGEAPYDSAAFGDSVTLYMNPEGTVIQRTLARTQLRDTASWTLHWGRGTYRVAPPPAPATVQMLPGRHFRCQEADLSATMPQLAALPHVGVRIDPPGTAGCIQVWNSTFVFAAGAGAPRLVGVVYDQFEW